MNFSSMFATTVVQSVASITFACLLVFMPIGNPAALAMQADKSTVAGRVSADGSTAEDAMGKEEEFKQKVAERRQFYFDVLLQELDSMVPGEYEEGSRQKAELERAINAFLDSDIKTLNEILDQQAAFDPDFPPRHLSLIHI